jgi:hypothetical protein
LKDTAQAELATIMEPLTTVLTMLAEDAIKKRMAPAKAWSGISDGFDGATKGKISTVALKIVTQRPTPMVVSDAAPRPLAEWRLAS